MPVIPPPPYDQQQLAAARTYMANERTLLTYVRTSLALVAFGLTLLQLHPARAGTLGGGAIGVGVLALVVGWVRFRQRQRRIDASRLPALAA